MSSSFAEYRRTIERWSTQKLGDAFVGASLELITKETRDVPMLTRSLEIICDILKNRPFDDREEIYNDLREMRANYVDLRNLKMAAVYGKIIHSWDRNVEQLPNLD